MYGAFGLPTIWLQFLFSITITNTCSIAWPGSPASGTGSLVSSSPTSSSSGAHAAAARPATRRKGARCIRPSLAP